MGHLAEHGEGKYRVWADVIPAGDGLVVFTGGGEDGPQGIGVNVNPDARPVQGNLERWLH
jgi:hypothetical protein